MKSLRVVIVACALSLSGVASAPAQFKLSKEAIQSAVAEKVKEGGAEAAGPGRRQTSAAPAQSARPTSFKELKARSQVGAPKQSRSMTWKDLKAGQLPAASATGAQGVVQMVLKKKITVIAGKRVTDAVTGELLDDAREIRVDEDKKAEYFDDGTHGDLVAGDGQYTRIEEITGVLGPNNQRIKEQLIQAVYEISRLDAREFYGHTLMSADNSTRPERNVRWAMVEAPEGRAGFRLSEVSTEKSVEVPNYWDEQMSRDEKIAGPNGWARTFLDEYRVVKAGLDSNFYTPYVPEPPSIPRVPPPSVEGWTPYLTERPEEGEQPRGGQGGSKPAAAPKRGKNAQRYLDAVTGGGGAQGAAEKFVNRGAGAGSTSGGYFSGQ